MKFMVAHMKSGHWREDDDEKQHKIVEFNEIEKTIKEFMDSKDYDKDGDFFEILQLREEGKQ